MLDNTTKKRIDDCRNILVGKLPDPKSQIEQITIALIYKFMDDMDKESIDLGGTAKFFSDDFKKYSWDSLFDAKVSATEMLKLYSESIESMEKNPNIPQLFRNIFKNAYLPYRDPETLKLFLKTIGEFEYTHSEKLGDAFEYLLSVMGSQGDAGQFRTPRHIIDFLVEAVNPSKTDTILDPACGTAGFLISAFKYIKNQAERSRSLTPDERKKLIKNFIGYDISPDMVRLSLVNLYLHGFSNPHIFEYDTLTSEERWNDNFDVILANPPFMSPKGGIRPHKKFTVSSNRSEVLFVDYIAEHLNPNGRAGIIVPEGVIFQSGKAYKELRKILVENYLYAVVSLPAGVFNPYSGVKTSILLIDKAIAKKSDKILFVKIDNDGYNLGAQRNEIKGGQLAEAIETITNYKLRITAGKEFKTHTLSEVEMAHAVEKTKIAENGEYNLSGERYKKQIIINSDFPLILIDDLFVSIRNGKNVKQFDEKGKYRVTRIQTIADKNVDLNKTKWTNDKVPEDYFMEEGDILLSHINSFEHLAKTAIFTGISEQVVHGTNLIRFKPDKSKVIPEFVATIFKSDNFISKAKTFAQKAVNQASLRVGDLKSIQIPLPPLHIQQEIVDEIEGYQKIIDGAKMVVENYKPKIDVDVDWEMVELGRYVQFNQTGLVRNKSEQSDEFDFYYLKMDGITFNGQLLLDKLVKVNANKEEFEKYCLKKNDFLYNTRNTPDLVGKSTVFNKEDDKYLFNNNIMRIRFNERLNPYFANFILNSDSYKSQIRNFVDGTTSVAALYPKNYFSIKLPIPSIKTQHQIVAQIEKEQALVNSSKQLIEIFKQKIKDRIAKVWGEDEKKEEIKKEFIIR